MDAKLRVPLTPERLAAKVADRLGAVPKRAVGGVVHHVRGTPCGRTIDGCALHDDCAIAYGVCGHGVLGWTPVSMDRLRLRPREGTV